MLLASNSEDKTTIVIIDKNKLNEFRLTSSQNIEYTYLNELNLEQQDYTN